MDKGKGTMKKRGGGRKREMMKEGKNTIDDRRKDQHITFLLHAPLIFSVIRYEVVLLTLPFPLGPEPGGVSYIWGWSSPIVHGHGL